MRLGQIGIMSVWIYLLVLLPQQAFAVADAILGVDSATGVAEVLTPEDAATLIGAGGGTGLDAQFDATGGNQITGADESRKLEIRGSGGQATSGVNIYQHSSGKLVIKCVVANVEGACDIYDELAAGKKRGVKNSSGTVIEEIAESTGLKTVTIREENHWVVAGCQNATPAAIFDLPTTNSPAPACEGTNTRMATLDFDDTTDESFADRWILPTGFQPSLGIDIYFRWKAAATSGAVGWCAQLVRVPDGATSDPSLPAQASGNCVSDTAKGTTLQENVATITGVTCSSCVAGDKVNVVISRDANGGAVTDSMTGDAKLMSYGRAWRVTK